MELGLQQSKLEFLKELSLWILVKMKIKKNQYILLTLWLKIRTLRKATYEEGCLSVPGQFAEIERPNTCDVEYLDYEGKKKLLKADGLLATCIQHEMDHLEGILFIDYLSKLKKSMIIKKLSKSKPNRIVV